MRVDRVRRAFQFLGDRSSLEAVHGEEDHLELPRSQAQQTLELDRILRVAGDGNRRLIPGSRERSGVTDAAGQGVATE